MATGPHNPGRKAALLDAILKAAPDAIVIADRHGTIVGANPATCTMFQHSEDGLIGQSVNILMPQGLARIHDGFMRHHIETEEARIIGIGREVEGLRKTGGIFPLHLSVGRAEVDGELMFVAIMHDLTQRTAIQNALSRSQRLDAVGQMTGGIAHDFNNLLTVIIGNLELLQMRNSDEALDPLIVEALAAAEMGAELTSRLMVFAKRSNLKPVVSDLRELCEDALAILRRSLGTKVQITTEFAPGIRHVRIDPVQLQSALVNLALNARDAMQGQGELLIKVENVTIDDRYMAQEVDVAPGDYVRLSVSDNGSGMDQEVQKRAFEPFYSTKSATGGNGFGLSMVYGFVRQSGGHITLYSEPGLGTSFGLYFPAISNSEAANDAAQTSMVPVTDGEIGKGRTVLVVEDNPKVRRHSVSRLQSVGFKTEEASNGDQAYAMLKGGLHADIVFSDLVMPGSLNGYDLAAKVANEFPVTKVLLTSGYASDVVTESMAAGTRYDVLHKPFRQADLVGRLQALLAEDS